MKPATELDILSEVKNTVAATLKMPVDRIDVDADFDSFGIDSIIAMELITNLSNTLGVSITPAQLTDANNVRELVKAIENNAVLEDHDGEAELKTEEESVSPKIQADFDDNSIDNIGNRRPSSRSRSYRRREGTESLQRLLDFVSNKFSINLKNHNYKTVDDVVDALVSEHLDELMVHYDILPEDLSEATRRENTDLLVEKKFVNGSRGVGDIAIIGIACNFPDAPNPKLYWDNLITQKNSIREIPKSRWIWEDYYADSAAPRRTISKWGALIDDIDCFDPSFFKITPQEARLMDPQERLLIQEVYNALQDAGIDMETISGSDTGVFVGYEYSEYEQYLRKNASEINEAPLFTSSSPTYYLANRLSYIFDFCGPSESININCASSAVAINRAYYSLLNNESSLAIAGGVSLNLFVDDYITQSQFGILSPNGTCAVFDDKANGYTRGEGVAVVILKRLNDAKRDNNRIYAVIKSCHQNNRGNAKSLSEIKHESITDVITDCYEKASISPETINYIEVDGYATKWGDSFEFEGVKNVFQNSGSHKKHCALGSVKGNIGNTESVNGLAGVIKLALSLQNKKFPATITKKTINTFIDIESPSHPLFIADSNISFDAIRANGHTPIRAGVNSFADSGTNVHILLEEYMAEAPTANRITAPSRQLFILSATDRGRLNDYVHRFVDFLSAPQSDMLFTDMIYTLQTGRQHMEERLAIVASSQEELLEKLSLVKNASLQEQLGLEEHDIYHGNIEMTKENPLLSLFTKEMSDKQVEAGLMTQEWHQTALLWVNGVSIPWEKMWDVSAVQLVSLPGYPFAKERHWVDISDNGSTAAVAVNARETPANEPTLESKIESTKGPETGPAWEFFMSNGENEHADSMGATQKMELFLKQEIALQLEKPISEIATDQNFIELGVNSLGVINIIQKINHLFEENVSPGIVFDYSDIQALSGYLAATYSEKIDALVTREIKTEPSPKQQQQINSPKPVCQPEEVNALSKAIHASSDGPVSRQEIVERVSWQDSLDVNDFEKITF